jgi:outer membrane protein insertion porin family
MVAVPLAGALVSVPAAAQTVASIAVEGNRRVEVETIRSYFKPGPGGRLGQAQIDDGLKALIETGLFQDVRINQVGGRLVVTVVENAVIGRIAFEGNKKVKDEQLSAEIQSKPRGTFSRPTVQSDAQRIAEIYRRSGRYDVRVTPEVIEQPNNRVDLIFTVTEGSKTGVRSIEFVGNVAYSSYRLKDVIKTRESNLLSFLGGADVYDPDRVEADRDLIRRFYLKNGYADVQVIAALTEYDPDKKGFSVTFKIEEGQQYRVASVEFQSSIATLDTASMRSFSRVSVGSVYNAEALEKSVEEMQIEASRRGYAFAVVRPRGDRNFEAHTVSIVFAVDEGPRTYIERINIRGNTRTRDYVIRREFDLSEGDAYNRALVDRAERRLKNLDFFKEIDRRLLGVGRLFDHRRCAGRSQHFRAQLPRPRPVCEGGRDLRSVRARRFAVVRRSLPVRLSRRARPRLVLSRAARQQLYRVRHQDARLQPAARLHPAGRSGAPVALLDLSAGNPAAERAGEL